MAEYIDREKIREEACKACTHRTGKNSCGWPEPCERLLWAFLNADQVDAAYTIYPETLPIVQQLRAELDKLRKEKRPTATLVKSPFCVCCSRCKTECSPQWVACPVCGAEIKKEDAND